MLWGEHEQIHVLNEAAALLNPEASPLRARLLARLATDLSHASTELERRANLGDTAVAMARQIGDRSTLAFAIMCRHVARWTPANGADRLVDSDELLRTVKLPQDLHIDEVLPPERLRRGSSTKRLRPQNGWGYLACCASAGVSARRSTLPTMRQFPVDSRRLAVWCLRTCGQSQLRRSIRSRSRAAPRFGRRSDSGGRGADPPSSNGRGRCARRGTGRWLDPS
jgi:hypothetical protein